MIQCEIEAAPWNRDGIRNIIDGTGRLCLRLADTAADRLEYSNAAF